MLFKEDNLGTNTYQILHELEDALNNASKADSPDSLSYTARNSIKQNYLPEIDAIQKKIAEQLHNKDIKLTPNFEEVAAALRKDKNSDSRWESNLGSYMKSYFEAIGSNLEYNKFKDDDMLYEGFAEAVTKNEIKFRIVDKLTGDSSWNQIIIEDGILYIQVSVVEHHHLPLFMLTTGGRHDQSTMVPIRTRSARTLSIFFNRIAHWQICAEVICKRANLSYEKSPLYTKFR
jgi:hypothetical protein